MHAFVFPGQGAQTIGMGKALADAFPAAQAVFDEVDEALGEKLSSLIWEGEIEELTLTKNAQPALMATSIAALRALESEGLNVADASFVAGHSLGEYSALAAAGPTSQGGPSRNSSRDRTQLSAGTARGEGADTRKYEALPSSSPFQPGSGSASSRWWGGRGTMGRLPARLTQTSPVAGQTTLVPRAVVCTRYR